MATVDYILSFASDLDGLAEVGDDSHIAASWLSSDGSPSNGCMQWIFNGGNGGSERCRSASSLTWEDMGVSAGATVTDVEVTAWEMKAPTVAGATVWRLVLDILYAPSGSAIHTNHLIDTGLQTTGPSSWAAEETDNPSWAAAQSVYFPGSDNDLLICFTLTTSAASLPPGTWLDLRLDTVTITITYEATGSEDGDPGGGGGSGGSGGAAGTRESYSDICKADCWQGIIAAALAYSKIVTDSAGTVTSEDYSVDVGIHRAITANIGPGGGSPGSNLGWEVTHVAAVAEWVDPRQTEMGIVWSEAGHLLLTYRNGADAKYRTNEQKGEASAWSAEAAWAYDPRALAVGRSPFGPYYVRGTRRDASWMEYWIDHFPGGQWTARVAERIDYILAPYQHASISSPDLYGLALGGLPYAGAAWIGPEWMLALCVDIGPGDVAGAMRSLRVLPAAESLYVLTADAGIGYDSFYGVGHVPPSGADGRQYLRQPLALVRNQSGAMLCIGVDTDNTTSEPDTRAWRSLNRGDRWEALTDPLNYLRLSQPAAVGFGGCFAVIGPGAGATAANPIEHLVNIGGTGWM